MYILAFETINDFVSVAIFKNFILLDDSIYCRNFSHAESILVVLEAMLLKNKLLYSDINYFITATGPSSFIKIRIGLTIAMAIEFITDKKNFGINLFELYNFVYQKDTGFTSDIIILNAYQDNLYIRNCNEQNFDDKFLSLNEIKGILSEKKRIICDNKSFLKLKEYNNITNVENLIKNFSISIGEYFIELLRGNINLNEKLKLEPFYLFNPSFVKKK